MPLLRLPRAVFQHRRQVSRWHSTILEKPEPPKMTGAERDWVWIRRAAGALVFVGAPLALVQQLRAEVSVRQWVEDAGFGPYLNQLRTKVPWLVIPADIPAEYAHVKRSDDIHDAAATRRLSHPVCLPPVLDVHVPSTAYARLETAESVKALQAMHAEASQRAAHLARESSDELERLTLELLTAEESAKAKRLTDVLDQFRDGLWHPSAATAESAGGSVAPTGAPHASVMDACPHLDEESEHTSPALYGHRNGPRAPQRQLVLSVGAQEAAQLRLQAIAAKL